MWSMHPVERHVIKMRGRPTRTRRWEQGYGIDYAFSGTVNHALLIPEILIQTVDVCVREH